MTSSAKGDADRQCLAARFVEGPRLFAPEEAQQRPAGWLGDLAPERAGAIRDLAGRFPLSRIILEGIAGASSYLFGGGNSLSLSGAISRPLHKAGL